MTKEQAFEIIFKSGKFNMITQANEVTMYIKLWYKVDITPGEYIEIMGSY